MLKARLIRQIGGGTRFLLYSILLPNWSFRTTTLFKGRFGTQG